MNAADKKFLREMINHHKDAIKMSNMVIMQGEDKDVKSMADAIIKAQTKEIGMMEQMLGEGKSVDEIEILKILTDYIHNLRNT